jgi:hypothetical protein
VDAGFPPKILLKKSKQAWRSNECLLLDGQETPASILITSDARDGWISERKVVLRREHARSARPRFVAKEGNASRWGKATIATKRTKAALLRGVSAFIRPTCRLFTRSDKIGLSDIAAEDGNGPCPAQFHRRPPPRFSSRRRIFVFQRRTGLAFHRRTAGRKKNEANPQGSARAAPDVDPPVERKNTQIRPEPAHETRTRFEQNQCFPVRQISPMDTLPRAEMTADASADPVVGNMRT